MAGAIPHWIARSSNRYPLPLGPLCWAGLLPLAAGITVLLLTIRDFAVVGRGTLAPWDAPQELVRQRLYGRVRNPMYLGVLTTVAGEALLWSSAGLLVYLLLLALAFHLRVVLYEEPALTRQFGAGFTVYAARVPRWIPARTTTATEPPPPSDAPSRRSS